MKLTVTNLRTGVNTKAFSLRSKSVQPGEQATLSGLTVYEIGHMIESESKPVGIEFRSEFEAGDFPVVGIAHKTPAAPAADATSVAAVGFVATEVATVGTGGNNQGTSTVVGLKLAIGVYDDADLKVPSTTATLDTATVGSIDAGAGTNRIEVTTGTGGEFDCTVEIPSAALKTVYVAAFALGRQTNRVLSVGAAHAVAFTVS